MLVSNLVESTIEKKSRRMQEQTNSYQIGRVVAVNDYVVEIRGLDSAAFYEKVVIAGKAEGYVCDIRPNGVMVAIMKRSASIGIDDEAMAVGEEYCAHYSGDCVGHVVDLFGVDKLQDERFSDLFDIPIESPPIPIMERTAVKQPMLTGIAGIDLMNPIGKGQRQLIIGDKKTGKTQIALDAIVNQSGRNMICIYVAVGKTKKEIKELYSELKRRGAMEYTVIIAAFNDELPPVLRNTPYAAMSVAEGYMRGGNSVLVVIDDLKRHADVYREISLLMGKVPGRDAYPPDIFYAHASLLEKGCQHQNGGSITILPIVETKGGDITDYISTNIISITDGQIVLSAKNFERGEKPAIHYGLSISRLGGAVQTADMKKIGSIVRRKLLAYLENREVFELANMDEMGAELRTRMTQGKEILNAFNQYKFAVRSTREIVEQFGPFTR